MLHRATVLILLGALAAAPPADAGLLWKAESAGGVVVAEREAGTPFNPASVVKVATSWWALELLGPEYRYETQFGCSGRPDAPAGIVDGALVIAGGGDPDFQQENAWLVARELNRLGIRKFSGGLVVTGSFWMGWEGGPLRRPHAPGARARLAGKRLTAALDPRLWDAAAWRAWREMAARRRWAAENPPRVRIAGRISVAASASPTPLTRHLSNPLRVTLKRFNVFSNNDIERIADGLGGARSLQSFLRTRLGAQGRGIVLETASGEGANRMTPGQVVELLRAFQVALDGLGLRPRDVLPVPGCDPGPVPKMFPKLAGTRLAGAIACKTGTLATTDGGVAVLSGFFTTRSGEPVLFCVAAPGAGHRLRRWRRREQSWLLDLIRRLGGARRQPCGAPMELSDAFAEVRTAPPSLESNAP